MVVEGQPTSSSSFLKGKGRCKEKGVIERKVDYKPRSTPFPLDERTTMAVLPNPAEPSSSSNIVSGKRKRNTTSMYEGNDDDEEGGGQQQQEEEEGDEVSSTRFVSLILPSIRKS